ncbi:MAG: hypothetical protein ACFB01_00435, partial [Cohaesibacteraceae bacterium]
MHLPLFNLRRLPVTRSPIDPFLGPLHALLPLYGLDGRAVPVRHTVSENTTYKVLDGDGHPAMVLRVHRAGN